jgi:hypothetical protein
MVKSLPLPVLPQAQGPRPHQLRTLPQRVESAQPLQPGSLAHRDHGPQQQLQLQQQAPRQVLAPQLAHPQAAQKQVELRPQSAKDVGPNHASA